MTDKAKESKEKKPSPQSMKLAGFFLFLSVLLSMVLLYHPQPPGTPDWNENTRMNLIFALVEERRWTIDSFFDQDPYRTRDVAYFDGHHYSDKIFGVSLLALPFYVLQRTLAGGMPDYALAHWWMTSMAVSLPAAISLVLFWLILAKLGAPPRLALMTTLLGFYGSMWFGYSNVFYPYSTGIACALGALYLTFFPPARRITPWNAYAVGFLLGYCLLCDYLFGLMVLGVGTIWLFRLVDQGGFWGIRAFAEMCGERSTSKQLAGYFAVAAFAGFVPLSLFLAHTYHIYGEFTIPYRFEIEERFREGMAQGLMGITTPRASNAWFISVHPYRGIFFWSPILLLGLIGCALATRQFGKRRFIGWLGIWCFVSYFYVNISYYMWWGGWSMGPRLLIPAIPFALMGIGELLRNDRLSFFFQKPTLWKATVATVIITGLISVALSLPLSLTNPRLPQGNPDPVLDRADFSTKLSVPQFIFLDAFYKGNISVWLPTRLEGFIGTTNKAGNVGSLLLWLAITAGFASLAIYFSPKKLPDVLRNDYPFATQDGTAAPLPPQN